MRDSELQNLTTEVQNAARADEAAPRSAVLHVVYPPELSACIPLGASEATLGRRPDDATPPLLHKLVSRQHFAVRWDAQRRVHTGVDLGSSNGSAVDGIPATNALALRDNSVLRVGPVLLVYERAEQGAPDALLASVASASASDEAIPGRSAAALGLRERAARVAADPSPVLLCGETGTGKEYLARELHRLSGRTGPFVALNAAALAPELIESELFGHVRGAFSGAQREQTGLFRAAERGTLLLDEIGELSLSLQPKLLRALQEKAVRPVGATRDVAVDVRVVAATNRDLAAEIARGGFRRDLYARLSLWEIAVPALRRRRADILPWIARLHARFRATRGLAEGPPLAFAPEAAEALLLSDHPENLRGLEKLVHAWGQRSSPVTLADLPPSLIHPGSGPSAPASARAAPDAALLDKPPVPTRDELAALLARHDGSVRATARALDRDRKQIYRWMKAYGLEGK